MSDEPRVWIRQFLYLAILTGFVNLLQATAGITLWMAAASPVLLAFGLDAFVSATREFVLARRIASHGTAEERDPADRVLFRAVGGGYLLVGVAALIAGIAALWRGGRPGSTLLGVTLAAVSMLMIPIIGSYMKSLAMELGSAALKEAAVFTFGNSYLSMVLLIGLLINVGMERWWGDGVAAIVMSPFIVQKGIQILMEASPGEFEEP